MMLPQPDQIIGPVSVVIPCFRCATSIARAIESVASQSVLPTEIILVDDASDDDTLCELFRLQNLFSTVWIKIIHLAINVGAGSARNRGWDEAKSEFIAFLDADDSWHPKKLELQLDAMYSWPDALLSGHRSDISPNINRQISTDRILVKKITFKHLLFANRFITPSVMVKREIPFRFRAGQRHMEDHLLWMQIASSGSTIIRLEAQLAFTYKPAYGWSGLSSNLWLMEKAECGNYLHLAEKGTISRHIAMLLCFFSGFKFIKRIAVVYTRKTSYPLLKTSNPIR
ncbi:MAG: glycosyltransferase family 2 protein [Gammaproteobacteria bacterium]|nr:glycosyltransferase family 2 protein [Gammaproteobacteria bacterium]